MSIDYLLNEEGILDLSCTRAPINLKDYAGYNVTGTKRLMKKDKWCDEAVRAKFPKAEINYLHHKQIMTKKENVIQTAFWLTTPIANTVEILQSFQNADKRFYLVSEDGKQYLVLVTDEFMEIRHLAKAMDKTKLGKKFEIGEFQFTLSIEI